MDLNGADRVNHSLREARIPLHCTGGHADSNCECEPRGLHFTEIATGVEIDLAIVEDQQ